MRRRSRTRRCARSWRPGAASATTAARSRCGRRRGVVAQSGWPAPERLTDLPGVGPYTAAALASFAWDVPVAAVDTNARRVIERRDGRRRTPRELAQRAAELLPAGRAAQFNQAMMELGATVCRPRRPACGACPVRSGCAAQGRVREEARGGSRRVRFEDTDRWARGRVLAALAGGRAAAGARGRAARAGAGRARARRADRPRRRRRAAPAVSERELPDPRRGAQPHELDDRRGAGRGRRRRAPRGRCAGSAAGAATRRCRSRAGCRARGSTRCSTGARRHGAGGVGCWVTGLEPAGELAARLVARGFEWGWQPHWMALDLDRLPLEETDARVALVTAVPEYGHGFGRALLELVRRRSAALLRTPSHASTAPTPATPRPMSSAGSSQAPGSTTSTSCRPSAAAGSGGR